MLESHLVNDFWRVNSYGYPNPFNPAIKSQEAWETFKSFYDCDQGDYASLKEFWGSGNAPRRLDRHAVESWKATFEEFGLLYIISRSNTISITPAGKQFYDAGEQGRKRDFVWIGLNLLFRYPLQGPPRGRSKSAAHGSSDLLPYRFLYSAMRDFGDYFWWTELERVLCRVFLTSSARPATDAIRDLRENVAKLERYPLPVDRRKGAFYNSLNQVANHAGMNHLVLEQDNQSEHYGSNESKRRHFINRDYRSLVSLALGDSSSSTSCDSSAMYVDRLATAPNFTDEQTYFDYIGASVPSLADATAVDAPGIVTLVGDAVFLLELGKHFEPVSFDHRVTVVQGGSFALCQVARNHRVILSTDESWTYLVVEKDLAGPNIVRLTLRRARPITNMQPIESFFGGDDG